MKQATSSMNMGMALAAAATVLAVLLSSSRAVDDAFVATTCKAAAGSDVRAVNLQLCMSRLGNSTASDTSGLAKAAIDACITNTILYYDHLVGTTGELEAGNRELKPMVEPLSECGPANSHAHEVFDEAKKDINERAYAAAMKQLEEGMSWTNKCIAGLNAVPGGKMPEPLGKHTAENIELAIIAKAITSLLIK